MPAQNFNSYEINDLNSSFEGMLRSFNEGPEIYKRTNIWKTFNNSILEIENIRNDIDFYVNNFKTQINFIFHQIGVFNETHYLFKRISQLTEGKIDEGGGTIYPHLSPLLYGKSREELLTYAKFCSLLDQYTLAQDNLNLFKFFNEPQLGNSIRIKANNRFISQDLSTSYLDFLLIKKNLDLNFKKNISILELGAGYGCLAYIFIKLFTNIKYIIVDIPESLIISQTYLSKIFPDKKIYFHKNFSSYSEISKEFESAQICFLTPNQIENLPDKSIDFSISINCLSDLNDFQIKHYLKFFQRISIIGNHIRTEIPKNDNNYRVWGQESHKIESIESYVNNGNVIYEESSEILEKTI